MRKTAYAVFASLFLAGRAASAQEDVFLAGDLAYGPTPETGAHAMLGYRTLLDDSKVLDLSYGLTTSRIKLPDGRIYWSAQPVWGAAGALAVGARSALFDRDLESIPGAMRVGWIVAQALTNSEMRMGPMYLTVIGAHQLDLLVPGWHPREKLSLGIQLGDVVAVRAMGNRSFSYIDGLNHYGVEFRLAVNIHGL